MLGERAPVLLGARCFMGETALNEECVCVCFRGGVEERVRMQISECKARASE